MRTIGFFGVEAFDIVLYIGVTLNQLQNRVLLLDYSDSGALDRCMKQGMELDSRMNIIAYQGLYYTRRTPTIEEMNEYKLGFVLVIFGWKRMGCYPYPIHEIHMIVNAFPHILHRAKELLQGMEQGKWQVKYTARDILNYDEIQQIGKRLEVETVEIDLLFFDTKDYQAAMICQFLQYVNLMRNSKEMRQYISREVKLINPGLEIRKIHKVMKKGKRSMWHE